MGGAADDDVAVFCNEDIVAEEEDAEEHEQEEESSSLNTTPYDVFPTDGTAAAAAAATVSLVGGLDIERALLTERSEGRFVRDAAAAAAAAPMAELVVISGDGLFNAEFRNSDG